MPLRGSFPSTLFLVCQLLPSYRALAATDKRAFTARGVDIEVYSATLVPLTPIYIERHPSVSWLNEEGSLIRCCRQALNAAF